MTSPKTNEKIRNIAIIAHVDHGKTTLVDGLLKQAGTYASHEAVEERAMDSMDLERERGITIMAKNASIRYGDVKINLVDTPGHADFGGEVERILGMVDGCLLLVDAAEGPLPQTRFVLGKALAKGHRVLLVVNKVDRPDSRVDDVVNSTFDLFMELGATEHQADFPILYACARQGWCTSDFDAAKAILAGGQAGGATLQPLFDAILKEVPAPRVSEEGGFQFLVSNLAYSDYVGRLAIGRIQRGAVTKNQRLVALGENQRKENFNASVLYTFQGMKQVEIPRLEAGDIGVLAGCENVTIGDTICDITQPEVLPRILVDPPTISMIFSINTSPLAGQEGEPIQSRKLKERLEREVRNNVALRLAESDSSDTFRVLGRGELQFAILIEQMRREGFEFMVGRPTVITKEVDGQKMEPNERVILDLPQKYAGGVTELFQLRKGTLMEYRAEAHDRVHLEFVIPTRGLIGIRSRYLTETRGEGLLNTLFEGYFPWKGILAHRVNGALISDRTGDSVEYALLNLEERGQLFVGPGVPLYEGMVIGEHAKDNDLNVNACREKKLSNVRAASAEFLVTLAPPRKMSLEQCLEWIDEDEWVEVTPESVRIRKKVLPANQRPVKRHGDDQR